MKPFFLRGSTLGRGRLTSHDLLVVSLVILKGVNIRFDQANYRGTFFVFVKYSFRWFQICLFYFHPYILGDS